MTKKNTIEFDTSIDKYEGPCAFEMMLQHDATHYTMSLEELVPLYNFMKSVENKPVEVQKLQTQLAKFFKESKKYLKALAADYGLEYAQTGDTSKAVPSKKKKTADKKKAEVATPASATAKSKDFISFTASYLYAYEFLGYLEKYKKLTKNFVVKKIVNPNNEYMIKYKVKAPKKDFIEFYESKSVKRHASFYPIFKKPYDKAKNNG